MIFREEAVTDEINLASPSSFWIRHHPLLWVLEGLFSEEKGSGTKMVQEMSGMGISHYWVSQKGVSFSRLLRVSELWVVTWLWRKKNGTKMEPW